MTPAETFTLAAYFFVLIILAVYGWHRYYLVYLYMRHRDKEPRRSRLWIRCRSSPSSCRSTTRCTSPTA